MRRLGLSLIVVGLVFLLSGIAAVTWAASQANAMSADDRVLDPDQYDFYVSAQSCSLGCALIGMIILAIGFLAARWNARPADKDQGREAEGGGLE
jgi:hypothetical protein